MGIVVKANVGSADKDPIWMVRAICFYFMTISNVHTVVWPLNYCALCQFVSTQVHTGVVCSAERVLTVRQATHTVRFIAFTWPCIQLKWQDSTG